MVDLLRDPFWQFIGVVITFLSLIVSLVPILKSPEGPAGERVPLILPDAGLGCGGWPLLLLLWWASAYGLYLLVVRTLLVTQSNDYSILFWPLLAGILVIIFGLAKVGHGQLALLLAAHFCAIVAIICVVLIGLRMGMPLYKDFSFLERSVEQAIPDLKDTLAQIPVNLQAVPVDMRISDAAEAKYYFVWSYVPSFFFVLLLYGISRRTARQRAFAREDQSAKSLQRKLSRLEVDEKELALKKLELEMRRVEIEMTIELAGKMVDVLHSGASKDMRTELIKLSVMTLVQSGNGSKVILQHLQAVAERRGGGLPAARL